MRMVTASLLLLVACTSEAATPPTTAGESATTTTTTAGVATTPDDPTSTSEATAEVVLGLDEFPVPPGSRPHDVAPADDGSVWYTAQRTGVLGRLDPASGEVEEVPLGQGSAPHGVIVGPDDAPWVTDSGLNAIVRVDPATLDVDLHSLPAASGPINLNTAAFDGEGRLWFTGQAGWYGRLDPETGSVEVFSAPEGRGPYGITSTPDGAIYYASLAGNHIAQVDLNTGEARVIDPPTSGQGSRRVWSDSTGAIWVSEWEAGQLGRYEPETEQWAEWRLPGENPQPYAVYVDEADFVWLSDFAGNHALVRFNPATEMFESFPLPTRGGAVRQLLGRPGELWAPESAADALVRVRLGS